MLFNLADFLKLTGLISLQGRHESIKSNNSLQYSHLSVFGFQHSSNCDRKSKCLIKSLFPECPITLALIAAMIVCHNVLQMHDVSPDEEL